MSEIELPEFVTSIYHQGKDLITSSVIWAYFAKYTNEYLVPVLQKYEHTSHLVSTPVSIFISGFFAWGVGILVIYEIINHIGISLGWWKPALPMEDEPDHTAHVYVTLNMIPEQKIDPVKEILHEKGLDAVPTTHLELDFPIRYHFEFSPEDYADPVLGTHLRNLRERILEWFLSSQQYYLNKDNYNSELGAEHVFLFDREGNMLAKDDEYLGNLGVNNGDTVNALVLV
ncbi:DEKNAAC104113 [Brettanomyces naardenensis]|uniref:DEKNAAC104113 n=1 Tax=Brettanomyces naardenensis TaxID=13370 RepID=A0A448YPY6_BRENA|nr:DEKNAAC104113 [Brettanomyces naardenensis]